MMWFPIFSHGESKHIFPNSIINHIPLHHGRKTDVPSAGLPPSTGVKVARAAKSSWGWVSTGAVLRPCNFFVPSSSCFSISGQLSVRLCRSCVFMSWKKRGDLGCFYWQWYNMMCSRMRIHIFWCLWCILPYAPDGNSNFVPAPRSPQAWLEVWLGALGPFIAGRTSQVRNCSKPRNIRFLGSLVWQNIPGSLVTSQVTSSAKPRSLTHSESYPSHGVTGSGPFLTTAQPFTNSWWTPRLTWDGNVSGRVVMTRPGHWKEWRGRAHLRLLEASHDLRNSSRQSVSGATWGAAIATCWMLEPMGGNATIQIPKNNDLITMHHKQIHEW